MQCTIYANTAQHCSTGALYWFR